MSDERDVKMFAFLQKFKPCPFCGYKLQNNLDDTFYPTGTWKRVEPSGLTHYVSHRSRKEGDTPVYNVICNEIGGGCGASMMADSPEEGIEKWNRRHETT